MNVQPFVSVTTSVYVPAVCPEIVAVVCPPGDHKYVYGDVPPVGVLATTPIAPPAQDTFVTTAFTAKGVGCVMVTEVVIVHPIPFCIVTVYVPIGKLLAVAVVCAGTVFHRYV